MVVRIRGEERWSSDRPEKWSLDGEESWRTVELMMLEMGGMRGTIYPSPWYMAW
jgi:hypothetical protein